MKLPALVSMKALIIFILATPSALAQDTTTIESALSYGATVNCELGGKIVKDELCGKTAKTKRGVRVIRALPPQKKIFVNTNPNIPLDIHINNHSPKSYGHKND